MAKARHVIAPGATVSIPGAEVRKAIVLETILGPLETSYKVGYWIGGERKVEVLYETEVDARPVEFVRVGFHLPKQE